jgi:hypothetical protein
VTPELGLFEFTGNFNGRGSPPRVASRCTTHRQPFSPFYRLCKVSQRILRVSVTWKYPSQISLSHDFLPATLMFLPSLSWVRVPAYTPMFSLGFAKRPPDLRKSVCGPPGSQSPYRRNERELYRIREVISNYTCLPVYPSMYCTSQFASLVETYWVGT